MEENIYNPPVQPSVEGKQYPQYPPLSLLDWMLTLLIMAIPIVNLVMLLVWAFSSDTNPNKANFAKAALLWMVIAFGLSFLFMSTLVGVLSTFSNSFNV